MAKANNTARIIELQNIIDRSDAIYYAIGEQKDRGITDDRYDELKRELKRLAPADLRHARVGPPVLDTNQFQKNRHARVIGSLNNAMNEAEFSVWWNKVIIGDGAALGSPKLDGMTLEITCREGKVIRCVTRGNGREGDDVTRNASMVAGIPQTLPLPFTGSIRGELVLPWHQFDKLNPLRVARDERPYKNPRNAVQGIIGSTDGWGCDHLEFVAHGLHDPKNMLQLDSEHHRFIMLKKLGFTPADHRVCVKPADAIALHGFYAACRYTGTGAKPEPGPHYPIALDGVVFTANVIARQEKLGSASDRPNYAIAYKFVSQDAETVLSAVDWPIGDGGNLTPVGRVGPVDINGATVSNVTLHNWNKIQELNVAVGDTIMITRSGDVIPFIKGVVDRPETRKSIALPRFCPICKQPVNFRPNSDGEDSAFVACQNVACPGLQKGMVMRWIKSLEIKEIGDEILAAMTDHASYHLRQISGVVPGGGLVQVIGDLYALPDAELFGELEVNGRRLGTSRAATILAEIDKTRSMTIDQFLGSLSIHGLGKGRVQLIREKDPDHTLDNVLNWFTKPVSAGSYLMSLAKQLGIPGTAAKFQLALDARRPLIAEIIKYITLIQPEVIVATSTKLAGKSFCFTTCRMTDDEKRKLVDLGGIEKSGVAAGLSYLVQKDKTKSTGKSKRATELSIPVISLEEFQAMLT